MSATADPLLQPYRLKHLTLRNRFMSTAHEPAYTVDGMPADRYRLYHEEKAKGGIGLTMIGRLVGGRGRTARRRSATSSLYKDEVVPFLARLADGVHEHGAAVMIQITHLGRRTHWGEGRLAADRRALPRARAGPPRLSQGSRGLGHRAHRRGLCRRRRAREGRGPRRPRDRDVRPPHRPVLVAGHQPADGRLWRLAREPAALRLRGDARGARARRRGLHRRHADGLRRGLGSRHLQGGRARHRAAHRGLRPRRLHQRHSRAISTPTKRCRTSFPAWARARRRISTSPAR